MTLRLARASVWLLLTATVLQLAVHAAYAIGLLSYPADLDDSGDVCVDPPCGPEGLPPLEVLPAVAPILLLAIASLLGAVLLVVGLVRSARAPSRLLVSGLLLTLAPLLVLVGGELVPHAVSPCWFGEIRGVCEQTKEHGIDWSGDIHQLAHGVIGWLPMTAVSWWLLSRWRPELLPTFRSTGESRN